MDVPMLDFRHIPLGSLYEERLVEDLLLLRDVVRACCEDDEQRLEQLGVYGHLGETVGRN